MTDFKHRMNTVKTLIGLMLHLTFWTQKYSYFFQNKKKAKRQNIIIHDASEVKESCKKKTCKSFSDWNVVVAKTAES